MEGNGEDIDPLSTAIGMRFLELPGAPKPLRRYKLETETNYLQRVIFVKVTGRSRVRDPMR
jgi:hypothetical protein